MNFKQTLFALAMGGISLTSAMSAHAANTFSFVSGGEPPLDMYGDPNSNAVITGSWYKMSSDQGNFGYMALRAPGSTDIPGPNGILNFDIVNTLTLEAGGGGHNSGNMIDRDAIFLGLWAAHSTTGALEITWDGTSNTATVNMSDWRWNFNGLTYDLGAGAPALLNNQDGIWGNGDDTLDYTSAMFGAFTGVQYGLHLVGSASLTPVPEASTYAMMLAGLCLVGFAVRRRK